MANKGIVPDKSVVKEGLALLCPVQLNVIVKRDDFDWVFEYSKLETHMRDQLFFILSNPFKSTHPQTPETL